MGVAISSALDDFIDELISAANDYIENYCGDAKFGRRSFSAPDPDNDETRRFDGNQGVKLSVGDLRSITSLTIDGVQYTVNTDFVLYPANASAQREPYQWIELVQPGGAVNSRSALASSYEFTIGQQNVAVVGKWGYSATPPSAIKIAATKLVAGMIKENLTDKDVKEIKQESLGDYSATYQDVTKVAGALGVNELLEPFKRKAPKAMSGVIII